jgi:hypothetical protein
MVSRPSVSNPERISFRGHASRARADRWYLSGAGQASSSFVADGIDRPVLREAAVVGRLGFLIDAA